MNARIGHRNWNRILDTLILTLAFSSAAAAAIPSESAGNAADYPLDTCIVTGEPLGKHGDAVIKEYDGREVRFCCKMCIEDFEKDQASFLKKMDEAIIEAQVADYPADKCPISGQKLGAMGTPFDFVHDGRLVRLCCGGCADKFDEDPEAAMATVYSDDANEKTGQHRASGQEF